MRNSIIFGTELPADGRLLDQQLFKELDKTLRARLPSTWALNIMFEQIRLPERHGRVDAVIDIRPPDGVKGRILVEAKRRVDPKDVYQVVAQLRTYMEPGDTPLVVAPFLGARTRELLTDANVNYMDVTGNMRLHLDKPVLYVETAGAISNPWKEERQPLRSLKGPAAGKTVRALCDFRPPYGVRDLAARANIPIASISRVVTLLEREALLERTPQGAVSDVRWGSLIERWTREYNVTTSNTTHTYLESRGLNGLLSKLKGLSLTYAVTGSLAAAHVAPITASRLAMVYVTDREAAGEALGLRQAERGANVLLLEPFDSVVFERTISHDGVAYAALSQVAADLLTGPGRGPEEGEALLRWMEENEDAWRR